ncbi:hypothetical protein J542_0543 [Acinetobacter baumannii 299505]|uniref:hypothetical protein n=1 Tax=Acinetobacter baumannii TaxID=470 RepID=UPI00044D118F|nr:hypothetical protein [Acinetobacter baumannii]EXB85564.1 hypothetical protein J542_0543 [Acinetobacter baumannii 299505]
MDNYKIKVKDEASADEARDLFKKLGYHPDNSSYEPYVEWVAVFEDGSGSFYRHNMNLNECVEITIAQLRDLVVLKRNDVKDATHEDQYGDKWLYLDERHYVYLNDQWDLPIGEFLERYELKPILPVKNQDPALFSIDDVWKAFWKNQKVQYSFDDDNHWQDDIESLKIEDIKSGHYQFRLKPQTIKVELELPKPFEPKEGDIYWFISPFYSTGYDHCTFANDSSDKLHVQYGAYRSEDDVKKAVEQLRKIRGAS